MRELFDFVRELVDVPSVSGSERAVAEILAEDLESRGFQTTLQDLGPERANVHAVSPGASPALYFCTHIDTVPPFIASSEDDDFLYGRGTCDAKGIAAAMVWAADGLKSEGFSDVGLLFVAGEEVDSFGARAANELGSSSRYVVVGEPTESKLASGHKGGLKFRLGARGRAAHSAYPQLGESAVHYLLDGLQALRSRNWGTSELLGEATLNVGTLAGGLAANVFAPRAEADVFIRVVGRVEEAKSQLDEVLKEHPKLAYEVISESDAVFCEVVPGFDVAPVSFGTDIPALTEFGKPLLIGPGSIHVAHTEGEKIRKGELVDAVGYYQRLAKELTAASAA